MWELLYVRAHCVQSIFILVRWRAPTHVVCGSACSGCPSCDASCVIVYDYYAPPTSPTASSAATQSHTPTITPSVARMALFNECGNCSSCLSTPRTICTLRRAMWSAPTHVLRVAAPAAVAIHAILAVPLYATTMHPNNTDGKPQWLCLILVVVCKNSRVRRSSSHIFSLRYT